MYSCIACICTRNSSGKHTFTTLHWQENLYEFICLLKLFLAFVFVLPAFGRWAVTLIFETGCNVLPGPLCVCVYFSGESVFRCFLCARLTRPGDKGVKFSNFLYCSKVKNCREKIRINELPESHSEFINWHPYTLTHPHIHTLLKAATLKILQRKGELG